MQSFPFSGKSYGTEVDWMDSTSEEVALWEKMVKSPNTWIEATLPLRMLLIAKISKWAKAIGSSTDNYSTGGIWSRKSDYLDREPHLPSVATNESMLKSTCMYFFGYKAQEI